MPDLLYEKADRIATITLNRPERLNAWGGDIPKMLPEAMAEADRDPEVACVVVTGAGRAFCAGLDLKEEAEREQARTMVGWLASPKTPIIMLNSNKPLVAAIPGPAIGVGFEFAMLCDYRIGATTAKMGDRHVALGLVPDSGAVITLAARRGLGQRVQDPADGRNLRGRRAARHGRAQRGRRAGGACRRRRAPSRAESPATRRWRRR